ncbi:hypothetical protein DQW50_10555 [Halorubrum sp. 48-1-W]|uniref:DUF7322 domain-containing protein n=1 Tax=Halorubrum sp. 48-1-W TaxID=2249761 RepID=UPI000DCDCF0C|nr:hypothetical protein [Halorubrum sp. 48-1-W]RAW45080.1 hypothetical protein DQW50_10555 [Halorubrum sp. 48-1-W]
MFFDEDDEGEVSFGESSDAEREMTPDIPKAPSVKTFDDDGDFSAAGDVDSDTLRAFVVAVIYANVAVLLVALGPLVWYFEGWGRIGAGLLAVGLVAGVRTYQTYRAWDRSRDDDDADEAGENDDDVDADAGSIDAGTGTADDDADVDPAAAPDTDRSPER